MKVNNMNGTNQNNDVKITIAPEDPKQDESVDRKLHLLLAKDAGKVSNPYMTGDLTRLALIVVLLMVGACCALWYLTLRDVATTSRRRLKLSDELEHCAVARLATTHGLRRVFFVRQCKVCGRPESKVHCPACTSNYEYGELVEKPDLTGLTAGKKCPNYEDPEVECKTKLRHIKVCRAPVPIFERPGQYRPCGGEIVGDPKLNLKSGTAFRRFPSGECEGQWVVVFDKKVNGVDVFPTSTRELKDAYHTSHQAMEDCFTCDRRGNNADCDNKPNREERMNAVACGCGGRFVRRAREDCRGTYHSRIVCDENLIIGDYIGLTNKLIEVEETYKSNRKIKLEKKLKAAIRAVESKSIQDILNKDLTNILAFAEKMLEEHYRKSAHPEIVERAETYQRYITACKEYVQIMKTVNVEYLTTGVKAILWQLLQDMKITIQNLRKTILLIVHNSKNPNKEQLDILWKRVDGVVFNVFDGFARILHKDSKCRVCGSTAGENQSICASCQCCSTRDCDYETSNTARRQCRKCHGTLRPGVPVNCTKRLLHKLDTVSTRHDLFQNPQEVAIWFMRMEARRCTVCTHREPDENVTNCIACKGRNTIEMNAEDLRQIDLFIEIMEKMKWVSDKIQEGVQAMINLTKDGFGWVKAKVLAIL